MSFQLALKHCRNDWDEMKHFMDICEDQVGDLSRLSTDSEVVLKANLALEREFRRANMDVLWDLHKRLLKCDHRFARFESHIWREPLFDDQQTWEPGTSCEENAYHLGRIGGCAVDPNFGGKLLGLTDSTYTESSSVDSSAPAL